MNRLSAWEGTTHYYYDRTDHYDHTDALPGFRESLAYTPQDYYVAPEPLTPSRVIAPPTPPKRHRRMSARERVRMQFRRFVRRMHHRFHDTQKWTGIAARIKETLHLWHHDALAALTTLRPSSAPVAYIGALAPQPSAPPPPPAVPGGGPRNVSLLAARLVSVTRRSQDAQP